jgi:hypothetical protein
MLALARVGALATFSLPALAAIYDKPSQLKKQTYDYVIIGGMLKLICLV